MTTSTIDRKVYESIVGQFDSAILQTFSGQVLAIKSETLPDLGTLSTATQVALQFFNPQPGHSILLNDPYAGGGMLTTITLVTCFNTPSGEHLLLAVRSGFRPRLSNETSLEREGLRIPPTPIAEKNQINHAILEAIAAHPDCPQGFSERVLKMLNKIQSIQKQILRFSSNSSFSIQRCNQYLRSSAQGWKKLFQEFEAGNAAVETRLSTGETIRLNMLFRTDRIFLDFSGTSPSKHLCMSSAASFGACVGAAHAFFGPTILPLNSSFLDLIQVTTPQGSLLNSKYPAPTFRGLTEGSTLVANLVLCALGKLSHKREVPLHGPVPLQIRLQFASGEEYFDSLPAGISGSAAGPGKTPHPLWTRNSLKSSIQEIETRFPLRVLVVQQRKSSGGPGKNPGGPGVHKKFQVSKSGTLHWVADTRKFSATGSQGLAEEIHIFRPSSSESFYPLKDFGTASSLSVLENERRSFAVHAGDIIEVKSGGGSGWSPS